METRRKQRETSAQKDVHWDKKSESARNTSTEIGLISFHTPFSSGSSTNSLQRDISLRRFLPRADCGSREAENEKKIVLPCAGVPWMVIETLSGSVSDASVKMSLLL